MAALITWERLISFGLTQEQADTDLVRFLIDSASEQVVDAAGSPIGEIRSEIEIVQPPALRVLRLPGLPIRKVHSVEVDGVPASDWLVTAGGLYRTQGWGNPGPAQVAVDYTHGMDVPADIQDLVCRMVLAGVLNAVDGPEGMVLNNGNLSSISIDDFREAYATGANVEAVTEMTLPERTRERLAERFGNSGAKVGGTW